MLRIVPHLRWDVDYEHAYGNVTSGNESKDEQRSKISFSRLASQSDGYTGTNIFGIQVYTELDQLSLGLSCGAVHGATIWWGFEGIDVIDELEKD